MTILFGVHINLFLKVHKRWPFPVGHLEYKLRVRFLILIRLCRFYVHLKMFHCNTQCSAKWQPSFEFNDDDNMCTLYAGIRVRKCRKVMDTKQVKGITTMTTMKKKRNRNHQIGILWTFFCTPIFLRRFLISKFVRGLAVWHPQETFFSRTFNIFFFLRSSVAKIVQNHFWGSRQKKMDC